MFGLFMKYVFCVGVILFILSKIGLANNPAFRALVNTIFVVTVVLLVVFCFGSALKFIFIIFVIIGLAKLVSSL